MKTITKSYEVYDLAELSDNAKMRAMESVLERCRPDFVFSADVEYLISERYPSSSLEVQYSFSFSQGDGVNLYGKADLRDFLEAWKANGNYSDYAAKRVEKLLEEYGYEYEVSSNPRYAYSYKDYDRNNIEDEAEYRYNYIHEDAEGNFDEDEDDRKLTIEALADLLDFTLKSLENFEDEIDRQGEAWFFDITEEEAQEEADANGFAFTLDGKLFNID